MKRQNTRLLIAIVIVLVILAPVAWWLASPLFIDRRVDEAFPDALPGKEAMAQMSATELQTVEVQLATAVPDATTVAAMTDEQRQAAESQLMEVAAALPLKEMDEPMPEATQPELVAQGEFQDADSFHKGSGQAILYRLPEGNSLLRFENFNATNGPDLHVLLATNPAPTSHDTLGEYLDLGSLKGNIGNQNYEIPSDVDLSLYRSVVIYCMPFHVVFATAALQ